MTSNKLVLRTQVFQ
ncbi:glycine cleavage system protein H [Vibrio sp. MED222]|nr:glycine cleavage system protein H [Vibrio sp. MED222]